MGKREDRKKKGGTGVRRGSKSGNYLRQGGAAEDGGGDVGVGDGPGQRELCDVAAELCRQVLQLACTLQQYHAHPRHAMIVPVIRGR